MTTGEITYWKRELVRMRRLHADGTLNTQAYRYARNYILGILTGTHHATEETR